MSQLIPILELFTITPLAAIIDQYLLYNCKLCNKLHYINDCASITNIPNIIQEWPDLFDNENTYEYRSSFNNNTVLILPWIYSTVCIGYVMNKWCCPECNQILSSGYSNSQYLLYKCICGFSITSYLTNINMEDIRLNIHLLFNILMIYCDTRVKCI